MTLAADMDLAVRIADEAAAIALELFRSGSPVRWKPDGSVVTDADEAVERFVQAELLRARPHDAVFGEELGLTGSGSRRWIIDPIDGTSSFVAGGDEWGVNIALQDGADILLGVVATPTVDQRWWASRGAGAFNGPIGGRPDEGNRLRVSARSRLSDAIVTAWGPQDDPALPSLRALPGWEDPTTIAAMFRIPGGSLDVLVDGTQSKVWDRAPLTVLVEEAGGRYSDLLGGRNVDLPGGLFTNGLLHDPILQLVRQASDVG